MYTFLKQAFDLVISLGEDCGCPSYLANHGLRKNSFPFDWLTHAPLENRINLIVNDFKDFLNFEDLYDLNLEKNPNNHFHSYGNKRTLFYHYHDFALDTPLEDCYPEVKAKYDRRIKRFYQLMSFAKKILFVWFSRNKFIPNDELLKAHEQLLKKFPDKEIYLLVIENGTKKTEQISKYILKKTYDTASVVDPTKVWMGNKKENDKVFSKIKLNKKTFISDVEVDGYVNKNKKIFNDILQQADEAKTDDEKIDLLQKAAVHTTYNPCGFWTSNKLEKSLCEIAEKNHIDLSEDYEPGSVLHVASKIHIIGGHSIVLDRWLKHRPENQKNSLAITWSMLRENVLETTKEYVKQSGGDIFYLGEDNESPLKTALKLREIASHYEKIVLHIHMEDVIPILAFGTSEFKRPITLFNHSDHTFWLGSSIVDCAVSFRKFSKELCIQKRNIASNMIVPLPIEPDFKEYTEEDKKRIKKKLGVPKGSKVVITIARPNKFLQFNQYDYVDVIQRILDRCPKAYFFVIGPDKKDVLWANASSNLKKHVNATGIIPSYKLQEYFAIADVALDSLPFSSTTSFYEAAKQNIPAFTLQSPINHDDLNDATDTGCESQDILVDRVVTALENDFSGETAAYKFLRDNGFPESFSASLKSMYENFPKEHVVKIFEGQENDTLTPIEHYTVLNYLAEAMNMPQSIKSKLNFKNKIRYKIWHHFNKRLGKIENKKDLINKIKYKIWKKLNKKLKKKGII